MPEDRTADKSLLFRVMAWCRQATDNECTGIDNDPNLPGEYNLKLIHYQDYSTSNEIHDRKNLGDFLR